MFYHYRLIKIAIFLIFYIFSFIPSWFIFNFNIKFETKQTQTHFHCFFKEMHEMNHLFRFICHIFNAYTKKYISEPLISIYLSHSFVTFPMLYKEMHFWTTYFDLLVTFIFNKFQCLYKEMHFWTTYVELQEQ